MTGLARREVSIIHASLSIYDNNEIETVLFILRLKSSPDAVVSLKERQICYAEWFMDWFKDRITYECLWMIGKKTTEDPPVFNDILALFDQSWNQK